MTEEALKAAMDNLDDATAGKAPEDDGWEWALVEIMGFRKHAGRCREVERFGAKLLRIDVPINGDPVANGWETHFYSGQSMFSYTPTAEAVVMKMNKPYEPAHQYRLPSPADEDGVVDGAQQTFNLDDEEPF